jgi:glycosyltransferase involved in cell wall biosynthesis
MRILHISTRLILGGSQENTVLSCEGQARRGHEVHLAFGPIFGPEGSLLERVERFRSSDGRGITPHVVPDLVREIAPVRDRRALDQLRELIDRLKPDIVHTHSSKAGVLGRLAAFERGERGRWPGVIHTIHGPPFMPVEGGPLARLKQRAINMGYAWAERRAARSSHVIVSVADAMTRQFLARGIGQPGLYTTVYSGMEVETFLSTGLEPGSPVGLREDRASMRLRLGFGPSDIVVGTVARLAQHKGHDDLLDGLASDLQKRPGLRLLWVGDGWWRARLVDKAVRLGLRVAQLDSGESPEVLDAAGEEAQVVLTGLVAPERVPGLMRAMDILAHPSAREGLPRTVPQALLAGVCPVAYDIDGTGEVCKDMETGRLVAPGDVQGLREAILWLADHPEQRRAIAITGRDVCISRFSAQRMVEDLERVYERAIARSRAPR